MIISGPFTQSVHLQGFSPEQLLEAVRGGRFEHYMLGRAEGDAHLRRWSLGDFTVDLGRYHFPVLVQGAFSPGRMCLGFMRGLSAPTWVNGLISDGTTLEFYPEGSELNYRAASGGEWAALQFTELALQSAAQEELGHPVNLCWRHAISLRAGAEERARLNQLVDGLWTHPAAGATLVCGILRLLAGILHVHQRGSRRVEALTQLQHRQKILQRSDEYLRRYPESPFELESLAAASGATARTLQRVFREAYGLGPQQWARCLALHRARRLLQSPGTLTVHGIAHGCGFRHMGRFSEYYQDLFGELPSATLAAGPHAAPGVHPAAG